MKRKSLLSILLILVLTLSTVLTGCTAGKDGITPRLRINEETNFWEVSYDEGETWESMNVKATGEDGKDGVDGKDGIDGKDGKDAVANTVVASGKDGVNGKDGIDGKDGVDGKDGKDGKDGVDGKDGIDGKDGADGKDGQDGLTPTIGENGNWFLGDTDTGIYAGDAQAEKVSLTFKEMGKDYTVQVPAGSTVKYYVPESSIATFVNWYTDEECTEVYNFNTAITADTVLYSKWEFDETFKKVGELTKDVNFGKANCLGTTNCFGSVYVRVFVDDHGYYNGTSNVANYLKGVFSEDAEGNVSINPSSALARASFPGDPCLILINYASAFSSYNEYIIRNGLTMDADITAQKDLAIKYFNTVDTTAENYHKPSNTRGYTFPSMAVTVVMLGALMEQTDTERYATLIKEAYDNCSTSFWNANLYLDPFYQLCAKYDWFTDYPTVPDTLATSDVLKLYGYGMDLAKEYPEQWDAFVETAFADDKLDASEAKAFGYHYAYQLTGGDVYLGVYGHSRAIVDYSIAE